MNQPQAPKLIKTPKLPIVIVTLGGTYGDNPSPEQLDAFWRKFNFGFQVSFHLYEFDENTRAVTLHVDSSRITSFMRLMDKAKVKMGKTKAKRNKFEVRMDDLKHDLGLTQIVVKKPKRFSKKRGYFTDYEELTF